MYLIMNEKAKELHEMIEELEEFCEMMESDRDMLKENKQKIPTHEILNNLVNDLKEIISKYEK